MRTATGPDVYVTLGAQRGATIEESNNVIDTSSKDSRAFTGLAGRYESSVSLDALYVPSDAAKLAIRDAARNGTILRIRVSAIGAEAVEQADCIVETITKEFPDDDAATFALDLTITGTWGAAT